VKDLLLRIAEASELPCARRKVVLVFVNCSRHSTNTVEWAWIVTYLNELRQLMNRVMTAHPSLRQHVTAINRWADRFGRISEFGLYTGETDLSIYSRWKNWEGEGHNDGFEIVNGVGRVEEVQVDENMDEDSDELYVDDSDEYGVYG
jgi:hypothetical protein